MLRLIVATAICVSLSGLASKAIAERVTEPAVEKACGDQIEGGCSGDKCAIGCTKTEGGKLVDYGCVFPNKSGATKAVCNRIVMGRVGPSSPWRDIVGTDLPLKGE